MSNTPPPFSCVGLNITERALLRDWVIEAIQRTQGGSLEEKTVEGLVSLIEALRRAAREGTI